MRRSLQTLILLVAIAALPPATFAQNGDAPPGLQVEADEFTGMTDITPFRPHPAEIEEFNGKELSFKPLYIDYPEEANKSPNWSLLIHIHAETSQVDGERQVWTLIDGERHIFEDLRIDSGPAQVVDILDQVNINLTPDQFRAIAHAESVRMKIGEVTFALPYEDRWSMRRIIEYVNNR